MDYLLARVAVKESPDFANVFDMVASRLRHRIGMGDHRHVRVSKTVRKPLTAVAGAINDSPTLTPGMAGVLGKL